MALTRITGDVIAPGTIDSNNISASIDLTGVPKISSIDYPGDDTAADPAGGQTIIVRGSHFTAQSSIYLAGNPVSPLSYINATALSFTAPASSAGVYTLYVINSDGGTAIAIPGLLYSGVPTWTTASGSIGSVYETGSVSVSLEATGDGSVTYSVSASNTIPTGLTLNSNGLLTGTVPATDPTTTYTFSVDAVDSQNQETARSFSITFLKDEVTWSSPANNAAYSLDVGTANTISLTANSAAGKGITYSVDSGSLPANVSISGSDITGTPNAGQTNTSVIIRATAADTLRYAQRTLYFTVNSSQPWTISSSATLISNSSANMSNYYRGAYSGFYFSPDGTKLFVNNNVNNQTARYLVSPAFSLTGFDFPDITASQPLSVSHVSFKDDGTRMFRALYGSDNITQYALNTAWNPGSDTTQNSFDVSSKTATIAGFYFSPDGTKLFFTGNDATKRVYRYDLSTPWSIASGTTYVSSFDVANLSSIRHIYFKTDGTRMFISSENGTTGDGQVQQFNLSSAWDITTATLVSTFGTGAYGQAGVYGMWFSADGEYMVLGTVGSAPYLRKFNTNA